jgi:hypothetical protein
MRKTHFILLLIGWAAPAWAGTEVKARLESYSDKKAWVDVEAFITGESLRLNFRGPSSHGSLIYDRESSLVTIIDDLHKTVLPLTQTNQSTLKFLGTIALAKSQGNSADKTYQMVQENARVFFNGVPVLKDKGVRKEGFTCDGYRTDLEGKKAREVWVASPEQVGMSLVDYDTLRGLAHLAVDLCDNALAQWGADTATFQQNLYTPQMPVLEILYAKGKSSSRFQILRISSQAFSAGTFDSPAGYRTLSLMELLYPANK